MPSPTRVSGGRAPKLNVHVAAEQIDNAIPEDSSHCMIADAIKAALPDARAVSVDLATIRYTDKKTGRRYIYLTPAEAQAALLDFDGGEKPEPFWVAAHVVQIIEPRSKPDISASLTDEAEATVAHASASLTDDRSDTSASLTDEAETSRRRATMMNNPAGGGTTPIKVNGNPPPIGPLARGAGSNRPNAKTRTGRQRKFGLRAMANRASHQTT